MDKETCENLYQRYLELKQKTILEGYVKTKGESVKLQSINPRDWDALDSVVLELESCLDFLSDDELIAISEDGKIGTKAKEILIKRKGQS